MMLFLHVLRGVTLVSGVLFWVLLGWFIHDAYLPEWRANWRQWRHQRQVNRVLAHASLLMDALAMMQQLDGETDGDGQPTALLPDMQPGLHLAGGPGEPTQ